MALNLSFSVTERNDNLLITLTDTTGTYDASDNSTGWGDPNPNAGFVFSDIVTSTDIIGPDQYHLLLSLTITTSNGTSTTYDDINLRDHNGSDFTAASDLIFTFDCADFEISGVALGTDEDEFPDGIYDFTYKLVANTDHATVTDTESLSILIDGKVRNSVYELLRNLTIIYNCKDCNADVIMNAIFSRAYLDAMHSSAYVSKKEELYNQLYVLERLVTNGSTYTWR